VTIVTGDTGSTISTTPLPGGGHEDRHRLLRLPDQDRPEPGLPTGRVHAQAEDVVRGGPDSEDPSEPTREHRAAARGLTIESTLTRLADGTGIPLADLQAAVADPRSTASARHARGWLFPATYTFDPGNDGAAGDQDDGRSHGASLDKAGVPVDQRERILTVASIIQREARFTADFYKVSRVIENRLDPNNEETHGLLQMDSTAQYGFNEINKGTVSSSAEALENDNPWNTYLHPGLPIGPIANPGDLAIDAAMHPPTDRGCTS
jgi:UPF0755 protein